jgi:RNA polymerase sigma-70 factor (ECF subfamily)
MQYAFSQGFQNLRQFAGRAKFSSWLTQIALNQAVLRKRQRRKYENIDELELKEPRARQLRSRMQDPEQRAAVTEFRRLLESAINALSQHYRLILTMRDVEEMSTAETAECLGISPVNVKVRLHRARGLVRQHFYKVIGNTAAQAFPFHLDRCNEMVKRVFKKLG